MRKKLRNRSQSLLVPPTSASHGQPVGDGLLGVAENVHQLPLDPAVSVPVPETGGPPSVTDSSSAPDPNKKLI